jgi:hypothetical protein
MSGISRWLGRAAVLSMLVLCGCAQLHLGAPIPSIDNIQSARASGIAPVALGSFSLAPGKSPSVDQYVTARTNTFYAPDGGSFARYLRATLATDLAAAGLLDPASGTVIEGLLTDSQLDVPSGQARGSVAARFIVTRGGAKVYDRELRANAQWTAPFIGIEAVPAAMNHYGLLYRQLLAALLEDPAFRAAAKR